MAASTPKTGDPKARAAATVLSGRLKQCWTMDFKWELTSRRLNEGCHQVGRAISVPPIAVLAGLLLIVGFSMSHSTVELEATDWVEPVLLWIGICMPTGSGKSALCKFLKLIVEKAREGCGLTDNDTSWFLDDKSFEKMGSLMSENHCKLLGLYDELPMFLSQINVFRGRGLTDSHELALFLQLYGGNRWVRKTVSGDANFSMPFTGMTLGGFMQPSVACSLIETQSNVDKGLCQRFLWLVPQPVIMDIDQLQKADADFVTAIAGLMSDLWVPDRTVRKWILPRRPVGDGEVQEMVYGHFQKKCKKVKAAVLQVGCMDDLLSGMLSRSRGQVLREAAAMHALFHLDTPTSIPNHISESAVRAADCFVDICMQQAAYLGGRGDLQEAINEISQAASHVSVGPGSLDRSVAAYCLLLPGKFLHISALLAAKRFRDKGNKEGAVRAIKLLEEAGLGKVEEHKPPRGTSMTYTFMKTDVPDDEEQKVELSSKLLAFGVSIRQYTDTLKQDEITTASLESRKRAATQPVTPTRKSPRKNLEQHF